MFEVEREMFAFGESPQQSALQREWHLGKSLQSQVDRDGLLKGHGFSRAVVGSWSPGL